MQNESYILYKFTSTDPMRPFFHRPFVQGDYVWATDATLLLRVRKDLVESEYESQDRPQCTQIFNKKRVDARQVELTFDAVREGLKKIPMVNKMCEDCDGTDEVEYEYQSLYRGIYYIDHTCPVCNGRGKLNEKERDPDAVFEIDGAAFKADKIVAICDAANALDMKSIALTLTEIDDAPYLRFSFSAGIDGLCIGYPQRYLEETKRTIIKLQTTNI